MTDTIEEVTQAFGVPQTESSNYALQFDTHIYVTEQNRVDLQKGMILFLVDSPVSIVIKGVLDNIDNLLFG